jgi:hypothetical protein
MSIARKTQAKYGAQIPTARKPAAKPAQPAGKSGDSADTSSTAAPVGKGSAGKKG